MDKQAPAGFDPVIKAYYDHAPEESRLETQVVRQLESEPSVLGSSAHLMAIGRKTGRAVSKS